MKLLNLIIATKVEKKLKRSSLQFKTQRYIASELPKSMLDPYIAWNLEIPPRKTVSGPWVK